MAKSKISNIMNESNVTNSLYVIIILLGLYLFHIKCNQELFTNYSVNNFEDLDAVAESLEDSNLVDDNNMIIKPPAKNSNNNNNNNDKGNENSKDETKNIPGYKKKVNLYFFSIPIFVVILVIGFIYFGFGFQQTFAQNMMYPKYYMTVLAMIFFFILFMLNSTIEFVRNIAKKI